MKLIDFAKRFDSEESCEQYLLTLTLFGENHATY